MLLAYLLIRLSYSTVIGIDFGSDSIKIAIGSQKRGVHRVRNYYLHDVTPNVFSYIDETHWAYGEGAIAQCRLYPETCIQNQKLPLNNKNYFHKSLKGYQITALSLIQLIKNTVNKLSIDPSQLSIVVAIPPTMTNREKSYLYSALSISKYNCVQFITTTYAPIETYLNEEQSPISNSTVFIDIGHEGVRVSGFEFNRRKVTQKVNLFKDQSGGKKIDENLMKMIIDRYSLILSNPTYSNERNIDYHQELQRNRVLLLSKIKKSREELSNKTVTTFEFKNLKITLTRNDIDRCSQETKEALTEMLTTLKNENSNLLRSGEIHIIGGCSRIPCLKDHIKTVLPNIELNEDMKKIHSISKGACYVLDNEINSNIKEHKALVSFNASLKSLDKNFNIFSTKNFDNFGPIVKFDNINRHTKFSVIDNSNSDNEYLRFSVDIPFNFEDSNSIEIAFSLNYFLMPVPDEARLIDTKYKDVNSMSISYSEVGWEISPSQLSFSEKVVDSMALKLNQNLKVKFNSSEIENYIQLVNEKLQKYFAASWRRISFPAIVANVHSKFNKCVNENDLDCPQSKLNQILADFKAAVANLKIEGLDEFDKKKVNDDPRKIAVYNLNSLVRTCKNTNIKFNDVVEWMNINLIDASIDDIKAQSAILQERIKLAESSDSEEL